MVKEGNTITVLFPGCYVGEKIRVVHTECTMETKKSHLKVQQYTLERARIGRCADETAQPRPSLNIKTQATGTQSAWLTLTYDGMHWQPGQSLPTGPRPVELESQENIDLQNMLQSMQHTIESSFEEVKEKLSELEGRITRMEEKQLQLEKDRPGTSSSSEESPSDHQRKRRNPSELQVSIIFPVYMYRV